MKVARYGADRTCPIDGCENDRASRRYCPKHYQRWKKHGDPSVVLAHTGRPQASVVDRWRALVDVAGDNECWLFQGALDTKGYAYIGDGSANGRKVAAYRVAYEMARGPIPAGLEIDHLCNVRHCCNPSHLEAVTHAENLRRARVRRANRME
jgi:HNH endonuclease